ncbi:MAG: putative lipid II flippase FtsW [Holosporales bacterium]|jgi:cell division protein FtsW|nr:putative lipid II flippase FtsW [Holosporales bacterium]
MANQEFDSLLKRWVLSVDRMLLFVILSIISIGIWISIASTPSVALKLGFPPFHFVKKHVLAVPIAIFLIVFISCFQAKHIRKFSIIGYVLCLLLIIATLFFGVETKGARRWLAISKLSIQPSEFLKPTLTVITAWLISEQYMDRKFPGILISIVSILIPIPLLLLQPDVGMTIIIIGTWFGQLFISGLSIFMIGTFLISSLAAMAGLYFTFPHFTDRIDKFITNSDTDVDIYQIKKSIEAFKNGGLFGKGPGEGVVKTLVPDSHSDFVFAVIGEEFGFIMCFAIVFLFVVFITRALVKAMQSSSIFIFTAVFGILFQIALQVLINICTSLNLIPTKGMTLPFISYGGSSMLSTAISIGVLLALTKRNTLTKEIL